MTPAPMLTFDAATFAFVVANLEMAVAHFAASDSEDESREGARQRLTELIEDCDGLPFSDSFKEQIRGLPARIDAPQSNRTVMTAALKEIQANLLSELADHLYLSLATDQRWLYLDPHPWFWRGKSRRFPDAAIDVRDACQCYALDQWTASVFHCMRILEHGIRDISEKLEVEFAASIDLDNWKNIVEEIEKQIRALQQRKKSLQTPVDLEFYAKAAAQLGYLKEAWRNHVLHREKAYDARAALDVLLHAREFMGQLASRA